MSRIEKIIVKLMLLILGLSLIFPGMVFAAEGEETNEKRQIVFLLDASKSMQEEGQWTCAADSACMIAAALPEEYEVVLLVYNTEIVYQEDFGNIDQKTRHTLETIELQGYTAPAAALEKAAGMFGSNITDKRVVFISDGEISMREGQETEEEIEQFESAVSDAAEQ